MAITASSYRLMPTRKPESFGIVICIAALVLSAPTAIGSEPPAAACLGFRGDSRHTGVYETRALRQAPQLKWLLMTGGPIRSSPLVIGSTVYVGSDDGYFRAVDTVTGEERWRFKTAGAITSSPAFSEGIVYFASQDHTLYALNAQTGTLHWRFAMGEDLPFRWGWDYYQSSPVVIGDRVFVGGGDGYVYAIFAKKGKELWRFKTAGRVRSSPAYADETLFLGSMDGCLYALDAATGKPLWKCETRGAHLDSTAFKFDRTSIVSSPAVSESMVVFGCRDGFLYGVDRKTGKVLWHFDHRMSWVVTSPALYRGAALAGSSDGHFFQAVDLASGHEKWRFKTRARVFASGTVAENVACIAAQDGHVYGIDVESGKEVWRFRARGSISSTPAVQDGTVYVGCDDGGLYALEASSAPVATRGPAKKAVYWESKGKWRYFKGDKEVHDYLADAGYETLDCEGLAPFLEARIKDGAASVIVFATDVVPERLSNDDGIALFRDYLKKGGKVVWLGAPPLFISIDPATGMPKGVKPEETKKLLGIDHSETLPDEMGMRITLDGYRWGLRHPMLSTMTVSPEEVTTVLATDELGRAAAWVRAFNPAIMGAGFVRLWGHKEPYPDLSEVRAIAEFGVN
jgi:eukaryotic-like serine/threonine-protein kinase